MEDDKIFVYPSVRYRHRHDFDFNTKIFEYLGTESGTFLTQVFLKHILLENILSTEKHNSTCTCDFFDRISTGVLSQKLHQSLADNGFSMSNIDIIQTNELALILKDNRCCLVKLKILELIRARLAQ